MKRKIIRFTEEEKNIDEGVKEFIEFLKMNSYRDATIKHVNDAYRDFYKFYDPANPISSINQKLVDSYISYITNKDISNTTKQIYVKDFKRIIDYFIKENYMDHVNIIIPKGDSTKKETYTDEELRKMLKKPKKSCTFGEYRTWIIINFLLSTGVRLQSLINIKIKDLDLLNRIINITYTKNRKPLILPLNKDICNILNSYLKIRNGDQEDYLFCNVYGDKLTKGSLTNALVRYNKKRGVNSRGIHKFRHTFAKKWIVAGGNVVTLSKILGHSNLTITERYINLLVSDLQRDVDSIDILKQFTKESIKMKC